MFQELKINGTTLPRPDGDLEFASEKVKTEYCRRRETAGRIVTEGLELTSSHENTKITTNC